MRISAASPDPGLGGEVGVGDLAADHADQVALAGRERPVGLQRVLEPAHPDHRQRDRVADRRSG